MKQVMCNVDLYDGETKAGKWYDVINDYYGVAFQYVNEYGDTMLCSYKGCAHLNYHPGAYWSFRDA